MSLRAAEARLDEALTVLFQEDADQVVLTPLGIHFFKAGQIVMVGELTARLPAMVQCLRLRAGISAGAASGMLAVTATDQPLRLLRLDFASDASGATAALIRRPSGSDGWPPPMLPAGYRIAA